MESPRDTIALSSSPNTKKGLASNPSSQIGQQTVNNHKVPEKNQSSGNFNLTRLDLKDVYADSPSVREEIKKTEQVTSATSFFLSLYRKWKMLRQN